MTPTGDRLRGLSVGIVRQATELRRARGWTVREMAERITAEGIPWDRHRVTAIENGRRAALTVDEWIALARVLSVSPVDLLVPVDEPTVQITPDGPTVPAAQARAWVCGEDSGPAADPASRWWHRHRPPVKTGTAAARAVAGGRKTVETAEDREGKQP